MRSTSLLPTSLLLTLAALLPAGVEAEGNDGACVAGSAAAGSAPYAAIDSIFEDFAREKHVPGMIFAVVHRGKLVHCRALGVQDVKTKAPVTDATVFRIASMTKSFTALAVLKLRDADKLSLGDAATKFIPELSAQHVPTADSRAIRVSDLLAHTSGFVTDDPWGDRQLAMPEAQFSAFMRSNPPFARAPGTAHEYSNYGYALLGRIVTNASGMRYQDYVTREILKPLGMTSSAWEYSGIDPSRRAVGYRFENRDWKPEPVLADGAFASMGGLHTSARDYVSYVDFLLSAWTDRETEHETPLARSSRRELGQGTSFPQIRPADAADPTSCASATIYGLGMNVYGDCRFAHAMTHSGGLPGYGSNVLLLPRYDVAIFAFTNLTYAPVSVAVRRAAARLYDLGLLERSTVPLTTKLREAQAAVAAIYKSGNVRVRPDALADNLLLDRDAGQRDTELSALRVQLGDCRKDAAPQVEHALSAKLLFTCERGMLEATVLLAPTPATSLQRLEFAVRK